MSFDAILQDIVDGCPGSQGAVLMGADGIPIAQACPVTAGPDAEDEVTVMVIEFGRVLEEARKAAGAVQAGGLEELSVRMEGGWIVVRPVDRETQLVLALAPDGNVGKGRFLLRRHLAALREEL